MPIFNPPQETSSFKWTNPDIPSGNTVVSSLVANPKVAFASGLLADSKIPEPYCLIGGVARISAKGMYSSGVVSVGMTVYIDMAGVTVASVSVTPVLNLASMPWALDITATILGDGKVEIQGYASFSSSLTAATVINIRNTASFTMSIVGGVQVTPGIQFGALAVGGSITMRQMIIEVV